MEIAIMQRKKDLSLYIISAGLLTILSVSLLFVISAGGELSENKSFFNCIEAVDRSNAISTSWKSSATEFYSYNKFVDCNSEDGSIIGITLESSKLAGVIDGSIPESIANCRGLTYLNPSDNLLSGKIYESVLKSRKLLGADELESSKSVSRQYKKWLNWIPLILGIGFFILFTCLASRNAAKSAREKEILKALRDPPLKVPPAKLPVQEIKPEDERRAELVFFVQEQETFKMDDLLESGADLRSQNLCSSLYKVVLKNNVEYVVKRLKRLQVSFDEFGRTMRRIGYMKHPNILPLIGYNSTNDEKLLIYKYQKCGSLLDLLDNYVEGRRDFPWSLRLSIASGIARGLDFIYQKPDPVPHGNLKLSNILLDDNMEPLISEYGFSRFMDPSKTFLCSANGYTAPERSLSEAADVYSFGVILLELLTGKTVEKTGIDLPKWVKAMVREEWTGEVFDKEVSRSAKQWAFPLLNVALKCVSVSPESRPYISEVLEKIEEVGGAQGGVPASPAGSVDSNHQDCCMLHSVIPEICETPGSNY